MRDPRDRIANLENVIRKWKWPSRRIDPLIFDTEARARLVKVGQLYVELLQRDRKEAGEILDRIRAKNRQERIEPSSLKDNNGLRGRLPAYR